MDPRILVVDDDSLIRRIMRHTLEALPATVLEAPDGDEAVRAAKAERPDLIFLDTMMPGMDGFQVAEVLKQDPSTADIPLIFVSALGTSSHKVRGLDLGAEDYLSKPIDPEELKARVRTILRRARRPAPAAEAPAPAATVGQLHAMPFPSLVRWLELEHRTARLALSRGSERGEICFTDGRISGAQQAERHGEMAVYQLLTWQDGAFEIAADPGAPPGEGAIGPSNEALLAEGARRLEEIPDLWASVPAGDAHLEVPAAMRDALAAELPPPEARLIALLDATRTLDQVLAQSPFDTWMCLRILHRLLRLGALGWTPAPGAAQTTTRRSVPRVALQAAVQYQPLRSMSQADRILLSSRGLFIRTTKPSPIGEQLLLRFRLPERPEWITAIGQVMWGNVELQKGKPDEAGMGLQFVEISPADLRAIEAALTKGIAAAIREAGAET